MNIIVPDRDKILLGKDLRAAAVKMTQDEARFLVNMYYKMQEDRIRAAGRLRSKPDEEPHELLSWFYDRNHDLEKRCKDALDTYSDASVIGRWMRAQHGIGPVIAAGMLAHIDIEKAITSGAIWRFAGLDPSVKWEKSQKRPWNADLKVLCWKLGESFTKVSGNEDAYYGQLYKKKYISETEKNEKLNFKDAAKISLKAKKYGKTTDAYKAYKKGMLPKSRILLRAQRYAVKIFLSHLHELWRERECGDKGLKPYAIEHMGHAHYLEPPHANLVRKSKP